MSSAATLFDKVSNLGDGEIPEVSSEGLQLVEHAKELFDAIYDFDDAEQIEIMNQLKLALHKRSPFFKEPVDCVIWVKSDRIRANDYNPNSVAPPEMKLLEHSITEDGYTQPVVSWETETKNFEVIDGFHRTRVAKESKTVRERVYGYIPITVANEHRVDKGDRIAATIRHNRARGKHRVDAMSDIVLELKRRNWSNEKVGRELGMDPDEVLRLAQITGLAEMFADKSFSEAWEAAGIIDADGLDIGEEHITEEAGPVAEDIPPA
jgi:ParB-like chromosome segregation protein Spo0J